MDSLLNSIISKVTRPYNRLSVISCPDGFLCREDTIRAFAEQADITVLCFNQLELRVWYETEYKASNDRKYIVVVDNTNKLVADIRLDAYVTEFNTRDLLMTYHQQAIDLKQMNYQMMAHLFENKSVAFMNKADTEEAIDVAETRFGQDGDDISVVKDNLMRIVIDWHQAKMTTEQISQQLVKVARQDKYEEIEAEMEFINNSFQKYLDEVYYQQLITATAPRVVHKILPYLSRTYGVGQKLALVVVDGLSYWQYTILRQFLLSEGISTQDDVCYAWIPSVTQLSRQAIFRGAIPERAYRQNPFNEEKLWREFWYERNFQEWHVMYAHEDLPYIPSEVERLAFVTMRMDEDMHGAHSMKQLYSDTEDWAKSFMPIVKKILNAGFEIVLTADHGSVPSYGWGNLSTQERAALYETGSRGQRHLIFNSQSTMQHFINAHDDIRDQWRIHGDCIVWRNNNCFGTNNCITHGGSHVMEMIVPLVKIQL